MASGGASLSVDFEGFLIAVLERDRASDQS
jgi:hypothetical protein